MKILDIDLCVLPVFNLEKTTGFSKFYQQKISYCTKSGVKNSSFTSFAFFILLF